MLEDILDKVKTYKVYLALGLVLVLVLGIFMWKSAAPKEVDSLPELAISSQSLESSDSSAISQEQSTIYVDIKGAVANEGVYELEPESRVMDLVKMAGGMTAEADRKSVNLAQKLKDEDVIVIAKQGEVVAASSSQATGASSSASSDKINLNSASLTDLQTISGIGEKRAQDIIDYRDSNGGFKSVDELTNVSGIGEKTLEKLKEEVTVD
ncbi:helix-hairpin-helix domain-containing protein [Streptococcus loxodontisalivarius]|uniref:Competence protein ComEA n=1 Tax=Streptococcus loxodontisalivarius TaxID=1349415 RepID=A0ABS2PV25_9STRE|nr:helix-hairpin-helix domain-containing protein [Streptococcus loxodontisalivarius]MBM7643162.1 competence protein ComEA [Streptococcus loxodontisalivarius]